MARYAIDEAIRSHVLAIPGVAELIGDRLYADDAAPQTPTFPYGVVTLIDADGRFAKLKASPNKTVRARYQFDFFAYLKADARTLAGLVSATADDDGLDGMRETIGSGSAAAFVQSCRVENARHDSELPEGGGERRIYSASFDAVIVFNE